MTKLVVGLGGNPDGTRNVHLFDCFVAREDCLVDLETLRAHPNVKHLLLLPQGWIVYEFHHQLFEDPDFLDEGTWWKKMEGFPALRKERIAMLDEQRALLRPWYARTRRIGDGDAAAASHICIYRFCSLGRMRWTDFVPCENWGASAEFSLHLESSGSELSSNAIQLMQEWQCCGSSAGEIDTLGRSEAQPGTLSLHLRCTAYSGHWLAGLWALLSDGRLKADIKRMQVATTK